MNNGRRVHNVSVLMSEEDFLRFEEYCAQSGHKKSTLICRLVREYLDREGSVAQGQALSRGNPEHTDG